MVDDLKNLLKAGIGRVASMAGVFSSSYAEKMLIVAFHRVNDGLPPDSLTCTSKMFEEFCSYFKKHFKVVRLSEQIQACHEKRPMGGTLSITFDDGYLDNYEVAAPFTKPADQVMFERGQAFKSYSSIRVAYALTAYRMGEACAAKKLDAKWCSSELPRIDEEAHRIDARIMDSLANPVIEVDWKAIYEAVELVVRLAGKVL
jgi:hypothetical protein